MLVQGQLRQHRHPPADRHTRDTNAIQKKSHAVVNWTQLRYQRNSTAGEAKWEETGVWHGRDVGGWGGVNAHHILSPFRQWTGSQWQEMQGTMEKGKTRGNLISCQRFHPTLVGWSIGYRPHLAANHSAPAPILKPWLGRLLPRWSSVQHGAIPLWPLKGELWWFVARH